MTMNVSVSRRKFKLEQQENQKQRYRDNGLQPCGGTFRIFKLTAPFDVIAGGNLT